MLVDLVLGVVIGLATGLAAWWVVARALTPRLALSAEISKLPAELGPALWRYRVKVANLPRWFIRAEAAEVRMTATLRIKGLRDSNWTNFPIPIGHTGEVDLIERNIVPRLQIHEMEAEHLSRLAKEAGWKGALEQIELEDVLRLGARAEVRVVVGAAHPYSGSRRSFVARYIQDAVRCGRFSREPDVRGLAVIEDPTLCEDVGQ